MTDDLRPECRDVADNATPDLRLRVAEHGAWFVVRSNARRVRGEAIGLLAENEEDMILTLDFDGVQAITNGCADEMVAGLIVRQDDRTIRVANTNDEVADAIVTALARRELTVEGIPERVLYAALAAREQDLHDLQAWRERAEEAAAELVVRDAVMAGLRDQLARQAETLHSHQAAIARVRRVCEQHAERARRPWDIVLARDVLAALDTTRTADEAL